MSRNCVRLAATKGLSLPSRRATAPWPANKVPDAIGAIIAKVMPSARLTPMTAESGLKARVTSNSGRGTKPGPDARLSTRAARSTVDDSSSISLMPRPVMPPNKPGVSGRPLASITWAPAAARPLPTSTTRPPRTSTSARSSVPWAVRVWTLALRISTSCECAGAGSARVTRNSASNGTMRRRFIVRPPAGRAGNRIGAWRADGSGRTPVRRRCRRGRAAHTR